MQNEYQLCNIQGHQGYKFLQCFRQLKTVTHICVYEACNQISRFLCNECIKERMHGQCRPRPIEIEKFTQHFKDQRLPQLELRLKSSNGNPAKLKYLTKIYENYFSDLTGWFNNYQIGKIKDIIQDLIKDYKNEIVQVQFLNGIYQQFTLIGVQSLNSDELNNLLDNQLKFINKEIKYYDELNIYLNVFDRHDYVEEFQQKIRKIQKQLRRVNDYLDFQQYSTDGKEFIFENQQFDSKSLFSQNERYFAMYSCNKKSYACNKLIIRKQNTLDVIRQLNIQESTYSNVQLDPQFNYCIIQPQNQLYANFYILRNTKQFKLIRKFRIEKQVREFYVSNNNIILVMSDKLFIKVLNIKNELINEIKLEAYEELSLRYSQRQLLDKILFCYGSQRNIFAIFANSQVIIYSETQNQPLVSLYVGTLQKFMKFLNSDSQLLILDVECRRLWQINCFNFNITQINNIESIQQFININELNFTKLVDYGVMQILDINHNLWFSFKTSEFNKDIHIKLTKNLIIIPWRGSYYGIQVIKRRPITNYERLEYDY